MAGTRDGFKGLPGAIPRKIANNGNFLLKPFRLSIPVARYLPALISKDVQKMSALFAFLHHLAFLTMTTVLTIQLVVLGQPLTLQSARKLQIVDRVLGIAAVALLIVGFLRVFYFEKGTAYYFHNVAFHAKLTLFAIAALLSIYPTVHFLHWSKSLKQGLVPQLAEHQRRRMRLSVHAELTALVGMALCAALMAKGIGVIH
jgi:putative membrane protein